MPMYDYQCLECDERFVAIVPLARRDEPQVCPQCKSEQSERIVSIPATIGWESSGYGSSGGGSCGGGGRFT